MSTIQHTVTGTADPQGAPPSVGAHYINTLTGRTWLSSGTSSIKDWGKPLPGKAIIKDYNTPSFDLDMQSPITTIQMERPLDANVEAFTVNLPNSYDVGIDETVLILDNTNFAEGRVDFVSPLPDLWRLGVPKSIKVGDQGITYLKFVRMVNVQGQCYYALVENEVLNDGDKYDGVAGAIVTLNSQFRKTLWYTDTGRIAEKLILPILETTYPPSMYTEYELLVHDFSGAQQRIQIDVQNGQPLTGYKELVVEPYEAKLFRFSYWVGTAKYRWKLMSEHTL